MNGSALREVGVLSYSGKSLFKSHEMAMTVSSSSWLGSVSGSE